MQILEIAIIFLYLVIRVLHNPTSVKLGQILKILDVRSMSSLTADGARLYR